MITLPLEPRYVLPVARRMRADDRAEIFATRWDEDPARFACDVIQISRHGIVAATDAGLPAAAIGASEFWPGVWSVWMFATDDWPQVALGVTKWARRRLMPQVLKAGAHRAQCHSLESHNEAHRWLAMLGAQAEARACGLGRHGEDFITFTWRKNDVLQFA